MTALAPVKVKRERRWPRAVAPFAVLLLLFLVSGIAHWVEEPALSDPGTLSPTGTGPDGSSRLARMLAEKGVTVTRVTTPAEAVRAARNGSSTVFIPAPTYLSPGFYDQIESISGSHRLVVLQPPRLHLLISGLPVDLSGNRWAARTAKPRCDLAAAADAGPAAVYRDRYVALDLTGPEIRRGTPLYSCYGGALVGIEHGDNEVVLVGATDPFRNSRINEHGNAALASGLLIDAGAPVIWVDVHKRDRPKAELPDLKPPEYNRPDRNRNGDSLWDTVPPLLPVVLVFIAGVAVLIGLARGRRLGPPVAEPLPVVVPAIETVSGRGRLYERAQARAAALQTLRTAAIARLTAAFGHAALAAPLDSEALLDQIALRTGQPREFAAHILFGPEPESDDELARAVAALDALEQAVGRGRTGPANNEGSAMGGTP